jgi:uncharacterized protein (UPF0276 family)
MIPPEPLAAQPTSLGGVGLGLRWDFLEEVVDGPALPIDFFEVSPENYMRRGGYYPEQLERLSERYPLVTHGLTLSIGAAREPDAQYLSELRREVERTKSPLHSDHLCFSSAGARSLHELLPLQHSRQNIARVAERARRMSDYLGVPFALENITYYVHPGRPELPELDFLQGVLDASGAGLLLDVNNVYVNSLNHGFDARAFIAALDLSRVVEIHVAGHSKKPSGLVLDTHGAAVADPVLELLAFTLERTGPRPVLLERDNDIPPLTELLSEIAVLRGIYEASTATPEHHARSA